MFRKVYRVLTVAAIVAAAIGFLASGADARIGGGLSSGSRGSRTFSAPPSTSTMPSASPMERTVTQPNVSFLGLIFQLGLIALIAMFLWRWFQRRNEPAYAGTHYRDNSNSSTGPLGALGLGGGQSAGSTGARQRSDDVGITNADYDAFERLLGEIQAAYSNEDLSALRTHATPEMVSYFSEDLAQNASRGVVNRISDVKLLQGDLAEAWREGSTDYATLAMRFALNDTMVDRAGGRVVEGGPQEVVESWTFRRVHGGPWLLSAIQQAR